MRLVPLNPAAYFFKYTGDGQLRVRAYPARQPREAGQADGVARHGHAL